MSRRVFLGSAAGGVLALVAAGSWVAVPRSAGAGLKALSQAEFETLQAWADAAFPKQVLGVSAAEANVVHAVDAHVAAMYPQEHHLTRLMLRLVEQRARVDGGAGGFTAMALEDRAALLNRWETENNVWGLGVGAIRVLMGMFYFRDARVQAAVGWGIGCDIHKEAVPA